ncbi:MAG: copper resistance D family protein [Gemmatimonadaceae bacterium]
MSTAVSLLRQVAETIQNVGPPGTQRAPASGFSATKAFFELAQFVGYFLAIGAIGFRFGIVRRVGGMSDEARAILRADNAAHLGALGVVLLGISFLGGPYTEAIINHKTFAESLPRNLGAFELKMGLLAVAIIGFLVVRAASTAGWTLATIGALVAVLQPVYTGRTAGKVNAIHILAASTWIGTLLVLTVIGIRGVIKRGGAGIQRAELVCDLVNSFSPLALTAASVVALSGLTTAWLHLKRVSALWTTGYGWALIVKLVFVLLVVTLGAWNWRRVRPSLGGEGSEQTIKRSATMELTFAACVLLATSVLVTLPSPR